MLQEKSIKGGRCSIGTSLSVRAWQRPRGCDAWAKLGRWVGTVRWKKGLGRRPLRAERAALPRLFRKECYMVCSRNLEKSKVSGMARARVVTCMWYGNYNSHLRAVKPWAWYSNSSSLRVRKRKEKRDPSFPNHPHLQRGTCGDLTYHLANHCRSWGVRIDNIFQVPGPNWHAGNGNINNSRHTVKVSRSRLKSKKQKTVPSRTPQPAW